MTLKCWCIDSDVRAREAEAEDKCVAGRILEHHRPGCHFHFSSWPHVTTAA